LSAWCGRDIVSRRGCQWRGWFSPSSSRPHTWWSARCG
ncbi:mammalian cell entry protein, partial [Mycobacterium marinum]